jgi:hypothetical protein
VGMLGRIGVAPPLKLLMPPMQRRCMLYIQSLFVPLRPAHDFIAGIVQSRRKRVSEQLVMQCTSCQRKSSSDEGTVTTLMAF